MPTPTPRYDIDDIIRAHRARPTNNHFFDRDTMRCFRSRILTEVYHGPGGIYFVTSEKGPDEVRRYTVRRFDPETATINTPGGHGKYDTAKAAKAAAKHAASGQADN